MKVFINGITRVRQAQKKKIYSCSIWRLTSGFSVTSLRYVLFIITSNTSKTKPLVDGISTVVERKKRFFLFPSISSTNKIFSEHIKCVHGVTPPTASHVDYTHCFPNKLHGIVVEFYCYPLWYIDRVYRTNTHGSTVVLPDAFIWIL